MKITTITYKRCTPSGEELSATAQLGTDDDLDSCVDSLKSFVRRKLYPVADDKQLSNMITESSSLLKSLGWTNEQGRNYLIQTYGKRSRQLLTDEEFVDFFDYLRSQAVLAAKS